MVKSHPAVLDGFVNMVREAYKNLGLFGPQHCEPNSFENLDYEGRELALYPIHLSWRWRTDTGESHRLHRGAAGGGSPGLGQRETG